MLDTASTSLSLGHPTCSTTIFVFAGALPPPTHGQSTVNARVLDAVRPHCRVIEIDLSPRSLRRSATYYFRRAVRAALGVGSLLRRSGKGNALYISADSGPGLVLNIALAVAGRLRRYSIFIHHHSFSYIEQRSHLMSLLTSVSGPEARHIFLCEVMGDRFGAIYGSRTNSIVCSNGRHVADQQPRKTNLYHGGRPLRIGLLSNLCAEKGLTDFLEILAAARKSDIAVEGILAGPPVSDAAAFEITSAIETFGENLRFLGPVQGKDKIAFFEAIDVFVFPTRYRIESYGLVIVEALAAGVPVIAYGRGCIPSYLKEPAGYVISPEQAFAPEALAILGRWQNDVGAYQTACDAARHLSQHLKTESDDEFAELVKAMV